MHLKPSARGLKTLVEIDDQTGGLHFPALLWGGSEVEAKAILKIETSLCQALGCWDF